MIVKYSKKFPYAPYLNEDIGFEESIMDNANEEDMLAALRKLSAVALKFHVENNPQLKDGFSKDPIVSGEIEVASNRIIYQSPPIQSVDRKAIERMEILIDDCATMDELVKYKDQVGSLGLIDMYHAKFDQLMRKDAEDKLINNHL